MRIGSDHNLRIFKTAYLILVNLQAVVGGKKFCFKRKNLPVTDRENTVSGKILI